MPTDKTCSDCGRAFSQGRGRPTTRCETCRPIQRIVRRRTTPRAPRTCEECGTEFNPAAEGPIPTRCGNCRAERKRLALNNRTRNWRIANAERQKQMQRESYHRNKNNPAQVASRAAMRLRGYGLTPETFGEMVAAQGGRCAICGQEPIAGPGRRLNVDHCHDTGRVRSLLCNYCNHMLGNAKDNPEILMAGAEYLRRFQENQ